MSPSRCLKNMLTGLTLLALGQASATAMTLDEALSYALEHNYTIRAAKAAVEEQEGVVIEARAGRMPQAVASAQGYLNAKEVDSSMPSDTDYWAVSLEVSQALYTGNRLGASIAASQASREAALADLRATIANELLDVRIGFLDVLLAREQILVQQDNVRLLEERLQQVHYRFEAGTVSNFDLLRAEVALANARPALIEARSALDIALAQLKLYIGLDATAPLPGVEGSLEAVGYEVDEPQALRTALELRPELEALRQRIEASKQFVDVASAGRRPTVEAFGSYNAVEDASGQSDYRDGWRVGLRGSWAIFDGGQTKGQKLQALARQRQTELALAQTRTAVSVEVTQAIRTLREADELLEAARRSVEQATEGLRLAEARYQSGVATQLDVLDAQVALTEARTNVLQANYRNNTAVSRLRRATGTADPMLTASPR